MLGVTRTLVAAGRIEGRFFSEEAAERGSRLHAYTDDIDTGRELRGMPNDWWGYIEAYQTFLAVVRPVYGEPDWWATILNVTPGYGRIATDPGATSCIERFVQSEALNLRGRIDRICKRMFTSPAILDFKFGAEQEWHGEQLALYNRICPVGARWAVYFRKDGTYRVKQYRGMTDDARAMADLAKVRKQEMTNNG